MPQNNVKPNPKHINSFWAIFSVVVVSMIAGGIIYSFAFGSQLQDELDSAFFMPHIGHSKCVPGAKVKCPAPLQKTPAK